MTTITEPIKQDHTLAKEELDALVATLALPFTCTDARAVVEGKKGEEHVFLKYVTTVKGVSFEYSMGIGHIPWGDVKLSEIFYTTQATYKGKRFTNTPKCFNEFFEKHKRTPWARFVDQPAWATVCECVAVNTKTKPTVGDILASAARDSEALDMLLGEFCGTFGYDTDSRKAEEVYQVCCDNARKLLAIVGRVNMTTLQLISARL